MYSYLKTLLVVVMCWGLQACEPKKQAAISANTLSSAQQAQLEQQLQQALILQQLQLQQQIQMQAMQMVQNHANQGDEQLRVFSATQACAIAGNCRVETRIVPAQ
ncbi:hypothetical protein [uncultured Thiothrix sp.]|uniref:hypothetical protein n=1 Tax=uncultured Thiothrix sp. TaxID=223185 RepID=UPI00262A552B|nr:hypothetical protein [uncultured Thiothrix sp.]HMT92551.1 hypothetical protein [Thiolinea sp.]